MELKILNTLEFKLNPPTPYVWTNYYMKQWDVYIETCPYSQYHTLH